MKRFIRREIVFVTFIFLLGAFLRLYHLDYPLGLHGDEAWTGYDALRMLSGDPLGIWSIKLIQPNLIVYWTALLFHILPPDLITLRFSYAFFWIISLPFFYGIVRILFGKSIAILAFFLFVIERTLIHFSHVAYSPYIPPFLISTFFFLYATKTKKQWLFALSGFLTGISLYFYLPLVMVPLFFFSYLLYLYHKPKLFLTFRIHLLLFTFCFFVTLIPLGIETSHDIAIASARMKAVSIFSDEMINHLRISNHTQDTSLTLLVKQIGNTLLMFHVSGDTDTQDTLNRLPLLDPVSGIFFLIGIVYCFWNIRRRAFVFLLLWFSIFLLGSIIIGGAPNFRRIQPSIAATMVIVALGITWSYQVFVKQFSQYRYAYYLLIGISIISICYTNPYYYFTKQGPAEDTKFVFGYRILQTAYFLSAISKDHPNTFIYMYASNFDIHHPTIRFIAPHIIGEERSTSLLLTNNHTTQSVLYAFSPPHYGLFKTVHSLYPFGKDYLVKDTNGTVLLYAYLITH